MARQRATRPGSRWQPMVGSPTTRVAGRARLRLPRPHVPSWTAGWRRASLAVAVLALAMLGGWWLYRSPLLSIQDVTVEGNVTVSPELARAVAGLDGESIIRPDFDGARARLLALSQVKGVTISRDWPNGVSITIVERAPWGLWQVADRLFVIDEEGVVLDLPAPAGAPVIVQADSTGLVPEVGDVVDEGAVAVARELTATAERTVGRSVVGLEFSQTSGLTAVLDGDLRVAFGDAQGFEFKIASLFAVLQQAGEQGRTLHRVDLRFGDRVAVQ